MKKIYLLILFLSLQTIAQTPTIDNTFNVIDDGIFQQNIGSQCVAMPNGKLLSIFNIPYSENKVLLLNNDGSPDPAFNYTDVYFGALSEVYANSNGKFLETGLVNTDNDPSKIRAFNADGTLNTGFASPLFELVDGSTVTPAYLSGALLLYQSDGKIIVSGNFNRVNGVTVSNLVRLNANGSLDSSFVPAVSTLIETIVQQADGKYMIGGVFQTGPLSNKNIARLNSNGSLDSSFNVYSSEPPFNNSNGFQNDVDQIVIQPDGKILVNCSSFQTNAVTVSRGLTRLNSNGTRDTSFTIFNNGAGVSVSDFCLQPDGKILLHSSLGNVIKRLTSTGAIDPSYVDVNQVLQGFPNPNKLLVMQNGKLVVNSKYINATGISRYGIHRLNTDGSLDLSFNPGRGTNVIATNSNSYTEGNHNVKVLSDSGILILGNFTTYNDVPFRHMCKLTPDGNGIDPNFVIDPQITFTHSILYVTKPSIMREQNDGKILFSTSQNTTVLVNGGLKSLVRINANGSLDSTFNASNSFFTDFELQSDGKIVAIGNGPLFMDGSQYKAIRLNTDGSIDTTFSAALFPKPLFQIEMQGDKILVILSYESPQQDIKWAQRLNSNGTLDTTFNPSPNRIGYTKILPDGKILVSNYHNSEQKNYLERLNPDGTTDLSFTTSWGGETVDSDGFVGFSKIFVTSQGKIIIQPGSYFNGSPTTKKYYILNSNGVFESSFGDIDDLTTIASQQSCDYLLVTGKFSIFNGVRKNNLMRYNLTNVLMTAAPTGPTSQTFNHGETLAGLTVNGQNLQWYTIQNACTTTSTYKINTLLPPSTELVDGTTYYASQTVNGTESVYRLPVTVHLNFLATADFAFKNLNVFPNPIENVLNISNSDSIDSVAIYNLLGQNIFTEEVDDRNIQIDFSNFDSGIYLLKINSENNIRSVKVIRK